MSEFESLKEQLKYLQNIEIEYAKDKAKWETVKDMIQNIIEDKYAYSADFKYIDSYNVGQWCEKMIEILSEQDHPWVKPSPRPE